MRTVRFVYVLPKIFLVNDHRAFLELTEKDGERKILSLKYRIGFINNPE